jgi:hypothetical protein
VVAAVTALLSLGPEAQAAGFRFWYRAPYAWLMAVPGWDGIRVPARFWMVTMLCLAVLLAFAVSRLAARWPARRTAIVASALAIIVADIAIRPIPLVDPPLSADLTREPPQAVVARVPVTALASDTAAIFDMIRHRRPIVNGYSGHTPPHYRLLELLVNQGDPMALEALGLERPIVKVENGVVVGRVDAALEPPRDIGRCGDDYNWGREAADSLLVHAIVRVSEDGRDVTYTLQDGEPDTGWRSTGDQSVGMSLDVLHAQQRICGLALELGVWPLQFPRRFEIIDLDGDVSRPLWTGAPAHLAVRGALRCQKTVPIAIPLQPVETSRLRLRLLEAADSPWWISELKVFGCPPVTRD